MSILEGVKFGWVVGSILTPLFSDKRDLSRTWIENGVE